MTTYPLNQPPTGPVERGYGSLNGATYVTAVAAPGEGKIAQVIALTICNDTAAAMVVNVYRNDGGGTRTLIIHDANVLAGSTFSMTDYLPVILIRDFETLDVNLGAAGTPNYYACWAVGLPSTSGVV